MKIYKPFFLLAACFMLLLTACKKSGSNPFATATAGVSFKFNGTAVKYTSVFTTYYKSQNSLQIIASQGTQMLGLMIEEPKVGTFDAEKSEFIGTYSTTPDYNNTYLGTTGKLVITKFTADAISGTFQFVGETPLNLKGNVTEGTFSVKINSTL